MQRVTRVCQRQLSYLYVDGAGRHPQSRGRLAIRLELIEHFSLALTIDAL